MKITTLIENTALEGLRAEHGLSLHICYHGKNYLLDTGSSDLFLENAKTLGIDLSEVDTAFLSHSHYDHSGGFRGFFACNDHASVYMQEKAKELCYKELEDRHKYIGLPKDLLRNYPERFCFIEAITELADGIWLIPHSTEGLEKQGKHAHMCRKLGDTFIVDDFAHEQSLVFETKQGLVVLNSCSHGGIVNIVDEVHRALPGKQVYAVVGGLHLKGLTSIDTMSVTEEEVVAIGSGLCERGVSHIYTGHCTGQPAFDILKEHFKDQVHALVTGTVITLED